MFGFGKKKATKPPEVRVLKKKVIKKVVPKASRARLAAAEMTADKKKDRGLIDILTEKAQADPESLASITRALLLEEQKDANVKLK